MTLEAALSEAKQLMEKRQASGFDQAALDEAARVGFANGAFEDSEEEGGEVVEEFFSAQPEGDAPENSSGTVTASPLSRKMESVAKALAAQIDKIPNGDWLDANRRRIMEDAITSAVATIRQVKSAGPCHTCHGKGCERCRKTGWIPKHMRGQG